MPEAIANAAALSYQQYRDAANSLAAGTKVVDGVTVPMTDQEKIQASTTSIESLERYKMQAQIANKGEEAKSQVFRA